jgi:hypothetical protein
MINVFNLGLGGFVALKGNKPLNVEKETGICFDITQETYEKYKEEYFNSDFNKYNKILRDFASKFKAR